MVAWLRPPVVRYYFIRPWHRLPSNPIRQPASRSIGRSREVRPPWPWLARSSTDSCDWTKHVSLARREARNNTSTRILQLRIVCARRIQIGRPLWPGLALQGRDEDFLNSRSSLAHRSPPVSGVHVDLLNQCSVFRSTNVPGWARNFLESRIRVGIAAQGVAEPGTVHKPSSDRPSEAQFREPRQPRQASRPAKAEKISPHGRVRSLAASAPKDHLLGVPQ